MFEQQDNNSNNNNLPSSATTTFDEEWEEWDGRSPFWVHCVAGSLAGMAEHTLVYPLDTVRTHIQVCASCNFNGSNSLSTTAKSAHVVMMSTHNNSNNGPINKVTGSVLQRAASTGTGMGHIMSSSATTTTTNATSVGVPSRNGMTMLQAIRQLVSQPMALESATGLGGGVTSLGGTTTTTVTSSSSSSTTTATTKTSTATAAGMSRLFRGVQSMMVGCIPAHALYFSSYEVVKGATLDKHGNVTAYGSALAGGAAVISHDLILGPLDTVKQRLQLGHYRGLYHALTTMIQNEGIISLYRSFPITLATNIPYGMVMVGTNEFCKQQWTSSSSTTDGPDTTDPRPLTMPVMIAAGGVAGLVASAVTTPLDRIKTSLQTQQLTPSCLLAPVPHSAPDVCPLQQQSSSMKPIVVDWKQAAKRIYHMEGLPGFFRGVTPRILSHTPAVAISWTTYETAKQYLQKTFVDSMDNM